ncbi:ATP-dependent helicase [Gordonia shandongensis]|uniref:ATP-dependent helicase n=1 Tax=Gordonia shandongensis TaxID=376351 RepID=UPI000427C12B|nr:ATP-dependent DNA helicase [Gordonia shandongensis]
MTRPGTRLVAPAAPADATRRWPASVEPVLTGPHVTDPEHPWRPWRVHGGPGTGKTSLIVDAAVARLLDPAVEPESVLVLAADRRAAARLRSEVTRRVLSAGGRLGGALREPLVRTVHSYAFAVLRLQASAHGNPPPRLITGSEQDVMLRELLAGDVEDGAAYWPERLRPALTTDGFAQALRDLMMRAAERGLGPEDLAEMGRRHDRPEWVAAGRAYRQYEEGLLLRSAVGLDAPQASVTAVDAAELIGSALSAFATDPDVLRGQRARIRHLLVDDAQHLDPQAATLVRLIGTGADSTVVAADTDQSVFGFRGADPTFADEVAADDPDRDVELSTGHRCAPAVAEVGRAVAARLPGARPHRYPDAPGAHDDRGDARVAVFASAAKEATAVADTLRRAHLFDDVPWSQMAVIVRSVPRALPALRRAFSSAGVPMATPVSDVPIHQQRTVEAFTLVLRAASGFDPLSPHEAQTLLTGPIGGADPTGLRRLRRGLRRIDDALPDEDPGDGGAEEDRTRSGDSLTALATALHDTAEMDRYLAGLTDFESIALRRVRTVIDAARRAHGDGVEEMLWQSWQASGLERRWTARSLRGGRGGDQADRDLDAVLAMFEAAGTFADTLPAAGPAAFVEYLGRLQIPRESRIAVAGVDAVQVVSAHAAAGREWEVVAVAGVLDGLWPSLRSRGSVLGTPALLDLLSGVDADAVDSIARGAVMLADERRLLLVACTRARSRLLVTSVEDGGGDASPSRFVPEIADALGGYGLGADPAGTESASNDQIPLDRGVRRVLSLPSMVAELRSAVVSGASAPDGPGERTRAAAALLADLAQAGVPGAAPADWFGLMGPSTDQPLWSPVDGRARTLSPSNVEALTRCSLRWMLERHGGRDGDAEQAVTGTLVHTLVQAVAGDLDRAEVDAALHEVWGRVASPARWYSDRERERARGMLTNFRDWLRISREELTEAGVEVEVDATLPAGVDESGHALLPVRIVGRMDRLERDAQGRPVVVDVKTGKTAIRAVDAEAHPQLATYQLAIALGGVEGTPREPGGGRLVYVADSHRSTGAPQRIQPALGPDDVEEWVGVVRDAAARSIGPVFSATPNSGCGHCSLVASCPAQLRGKTVIDD